jgi:DNA-binding transcriptional ArsR family regulator
MMEDQHFLNIMTLIGEPARARMLWNLLDGRAYTAGELAMEADISATSASNHLTKLLEAELLKVESQGRHRYYTFSRPEVAYVVESLASLAKHDIKKVTSNKNELPAIKYCRTCYDHLAGYVGVQITSGLEKKGLIKKSGAEFIVTSKGWAWLENFDIHKNELDGKRRLLTRQCLDWSERKPHLAGQVGAMLLDKMIERAWFKNVKFSRELVVTSKGKIELYDLLGIGI